MSRLDPIANRLPTELVDRARPLLGPVVRAARRAVGPEVSTSDRSTPSPYVQWHGPVSSAKHAALTCTAVADIALLQGRAPVDSRVEIELSSQSALLPATHRFPHPDSPLGPADCFELTVDHGQVATPSGGSVQARLLVDGTIPEGSTNEGWVDIPALPAPGAMVGVEDLLSCPACGSPELRLAGRRQHLEMHTCQRCQLVMTTPRPAEDHTLVRYNDTYFENEYLPSQQLTPALLGHIDSILDHAEPAREASNTLFELGVGGGNLSNRASERGWAVRGTDVNAASIAHAKGRGLDVWLENADHATSLGGEYGAIISEMSLEHVRRPGHFCRLAANALVPGGRLVVYTVSAEGESFEHSGMASPLVGPAEHLFLFSAGSLVALAERSGLRVDHVWRSPSGDEIGMVATKRSDTGNPAISASYD